MKKLITITSLLFILYSPAHALTWKPTFRHELNPYRQPVINLHLPTYTLKDAKDFPPIIYKNERFGLIGIVNDSIKEYQVSEEMQEKRLNWFEKLQEYFFKIKGFKRYFKWEF